MYRLLDIIVFIRNTFDSFKNVFYMICYTIMVFSAVIHDVICTTKIIIDQGDSRGQ